MTKRRWTTAIAVLMTVGADVVSIQPRDGWHEDRDAWEFVAGGRVTGLVRANGNQDSGGILMHAARFTPDGELAHITVLRLLSRTSAGMSVEKRHGPATSVMNADYKRILAANAQLSGEVTNQFLSKRAYALRATLTDAALERLERQTLDLPAFNSLAIDVGGAMPGAHLRLGPAPDGSVDARFVADAGAVRR